MEILSNYPTPSQIEDCIQQNTGASTTDRFKLVSALLKHIIPGSYPQLPGHTQNAITDLFRSAIGLGNLISRMKALLGSKSDGKDAISASLQAHTLLLGQVLMPGIVAQILEDPSPASLREVDKLLFKGLCLSVMRETVMKYDIQAPPMLGNLESYTIFLSSELAKVEIVNPFLSSLLSLGSPATFFDYFFTEDKLTHLKKFSGGLRRFEKKQLFSRYLDFLLSRYLRESGTHESLTALSVITSSCDISLIDELVLESVISTYNFNLNMLIALLVPQPMESIQKLLMSWGNKTLIANEPITKQGYRTHALLCLCEQLEAADADILMKSSAFVEAISNRLSSLSHQVKSLGVYFANKISDIAHTQRIFEMSSADDDIASNFPSLSIKRTDIVLELSDAWEILAAPSVILPEENPTDLSIGQLAVNTPHPDSDASDEEDDPTIGTKKKVPRPIYIKDLLAYLSVDVKDPDAYDKRKIALRTAPSLLRQKSLFGSEVAFYSEDLMTQLVALMNHFEDDDFETSRLSAMIAVVVSHPDVTPHICQLLLTGDYSLQQRLCLLSAMSFAARALRGQKDEVVEASFKPSVFPTQKLPDNLHEQYQAMDFGYSAIENKLQNELMQEASQKARDSISGGTVLRISSKLAKKETANEVSADYSENFTKIVGKRFFFPLIAVWYESGGIDIGHYSPVLIAHYVRTLSLVLHCAYPNAADLNEMAGEFIALITPILRSTSVDQIQVLESLITGVLLVCEIVDPSYAILHFDRDLFIVEKLLSECWEQIIDDRVKSLCAGLLLKLSQLRESMQRTLLAESGFY